MVSISISSVLLIISVIGTLTALGTAEQDIKRGPFRVMDRADGSGGFGMDKRGAPVMDRLMGGGGFGFYRRRRPVVMDRMNGGGGFGMEKRAVVMDRMNGGGGFGMVKRQQQMSPLMVSGFGFR